MWYFIRRRAFALMLLLVVLLPLCAGARTRGKEELIPLNLDEAGTQAFEERSYFQARWIQVTATIEDTQDVTIRVVLDEDHTPNAADRVVYKRTTKNVTGTYQSPEIFLPFRGSQIEPYRIDLLVDQQVIHTAEVHRMLLNLSGNSVCLTGVRFRDIDPDFTATWFTFHPVNFSKVEDGDTINLVGSNMYLVGQLVISRNEEKVKFDVRTYDEMDAAAQGEAPLVDEHLHSYTIADHAFDFSDVRIGLYRKFSEIEDVSRHSISKHIVLGEWYSANKIGAYGSVILYLNGKISYNPNGLPRVNPTEGKGSLMRLLDRFAY